MPSCGSAQEGILSLLKFNNSTESDPIEGRRHQDRRLRHLSTCTSYEEDKNLELAPAVPTMSGRRRLQAGGRRTQRVVPTPKEKNDRRRDPDS